ncbi:alpha-ketoglutarate-dependent dioxygenase AlkB family protein [Agarivorans sp. QJM3NY_33]|uniref:alpha-ketoglutarate-dependent dioxygenase AlkB family protein n=1 Tax=Agarivorans sp. QJM3NY_33 TaxID=3421432 RepID=UPI003D7DC790
MNQLSDEIIFYKHWLSPANVDRLFQSLLAELPWQQHQIRLFGKTCLEPRLSVWLGDAEAAYRYSGEWRQPLTWPEFLIPIKAALQQHTGQRFNSALVNLYRDGHDYMGWHSDNEAQLGLRPIIASLSLGASRRFVFRDKSTRSKLQYLLGSGDLLLMNGLSQQQWQHSLPKALKVKQPRINLTFRYTMPTIESMKE